jgi:hypothetical protein
MGNILQNNMFRSFIRIFGITSMGFIIGMLVTFIFRQLQTPEGQVADLTGVTALPGPIVGITELPVWLIVGTLFAVGAFLSVTGLLSTLIPDTKPGLSKAIPGALIGFIFAAFFVFILRGLQQVEPWFSVGPVLVLGAFTITAGFLWGMGGFDSRLAEHHAESPEGGLVTSLIKPEEIEEHHHEHPETPQGILGAEIWRVTTITLLLTLVIFAFVTIPNRLVLRQTNDPVASPTSFAQNVSFDLPLGLGSFEGSQLAVFIGFILFTMFSIFLTAGGIGALMWFLNRNVNEVKAESAQQSPLVPRFVGRIAGNIAYALRRGLPSFFGQK